MKVRFKNLQKIGILSLVLFILLNITVFANIGIEDEVSAYLLGDYETGIVLEGYNIDEVVEIASITKLMSYAVIMDAIEDGLVSRGDIIQIDEDITRIKGSSLNLEEGERFTLQELLEALMVVSANDATYALSKHVGGSEEVFVEMMNKKALEIGLRDSSFVNSTGLPQGESQNTMSPMEIFALSRYIITEYPEVVEISTIPYVEIKNRDYRKDNTNPLLYEIPGIDGLKTGYTNKAGYCLVSTLGVQALNEESEDFRFIAIVMGTENEQKRKEMGKKLVEYGLGNYSKKQVLREDLPLDTVHLENSREKDVEVYPMRDFSAFVKNEDQVKVETIIDEDLKYPIKKSERIGKAIIYKNDEIIEEVDLTVNIDVKRQGIFMNIYDKIIGFTYSLLEKIMG